MNSQNLHPFHSLKNESLTLCETEMIEWAKGLAKRLQDLPRPTRALTLTLDGELGAGKSTLARALLLSLDAKPPIPSPSYPLLIPHQTPWLPVYHFDFYRLKGDELSSLCYDELCLEPSLHLIEWSCHFENLLAKPRLAITLENGKSELERVLHFKIVLS